MGIEADKFVRSLTMKVQTIGKEVIMSNLSKEESFTARDAMAKTIYDKLFNWIVKRIN